MYEPKIGDAVTVDIVGEIVKEVQVDHTKIFGYPNHFFIDFGRHGYAIVDRDCILPAPVPGILEEKLEWPYVAPDWSC